MRSFIGGTFLLVGIIGICFFTSQAEFYKIFSGFTLSFVGYAILLRNQDSHFKILIGLAIFIRFLLVFSFPSLSDDIYRFLWDGILVTNCINPYTHLPSEVLNTVLGLDESLFGSLNSAAYYTVYPPVSQMIFSLSVWAWPESITTSAVLLKTLLLIAEMGVLYMLYVLLSQLRLPRFLLLVYALNPLVIVEVMGNAHFEGVMLVFLLISIYFLRSTAYVYLFIGGIALALSIGTKMHTAMLVPLFLVVLGVRQGAICFLGLLLGTIVIFSPWWIQFGDIGVVESLDLYFRQFEFNASLYYLARWIGFQLSGYNLIHVIGPLLSLLAWVVISFIAYKAWLNKIHFESEKIFGYSVAIFIVFLACTTTIHPWYLIVPLGLSVFTKIRFVLIWSYIVTLSYIHYMRGEFIENYWLIAIEYFSVLAFAVIVDGKLWERRKGLASKGESTYYS